MKYYLALALLVSLNCFAQTKKGSAAPSNSGKMVQFDGAQDATPDVGDGCGLGWQVTQKRSMIASTTRGTTNAFVPPTFGMTSGTIGCAQHPFAKKNEGAVKFIASNYDVLMMDMAQGQGEYLSAFSRSLGCSDSVAPAFGQASKAHLSEIMGASRTPTEVLLRVKAVIESDSSLNAACAVRS